MISGRTALAPIRRSSAELFVSMMFPSPWSASRPPISPARTHCATTSGPRLPPDGLLRPNDPRRQTLAHLSRICCTPMAGRLAPGVTRTQAQAELAVLIDQFRTDNQIDGAARNIVLAGTSWMAGPRKKSASRRRHYAPLCRSHAGAAAGVRQYRQSLCWPAPRAPARDRAPPFARRQPLPSRAPTAGRKHAAGAHGGCGGPANGVLRSIR